MPTERRDGYTEIGSRCWPFESKLSLDQATGLRDFVLNDYLLTVPKIHVTHYDTQSKVAHAKLFPNKFMEDVDDVPSVFGSAMLKNIDADTWRLVIMQTRTKRRSENIAQQRIVSRMNVEVMGDQVVEAVKKVQIVRGLGELTLESIEKAWVQNDEGELPIAVFVNDKSNEQVYQVERKAYERHMTPVDCEKAVEFLGKMSRRIVAVG